MFLSWDRGIEPVIPLAKMSMGRVVEFLEWLVAGHNPRDTPSCLGISATCSSNKRTRMAHRATGTGTPHMSEYNVSGRLKMLGRWIRAGKVRPDLSSDPHATAIET